MILTVLLLLELIVGVLIFVFYYIPTARAEMGFLGPEETLKEAVVRWVTSTGYLFFSGFNLNRVTKVELHGFMIPACSK